MAIPRAYFWASQSQDHRCPAGGMSARKLLGCKVFTELRKVRIPRKIREAEDIKRRQGRWIFRTRVAEPSKLINLFVDQNTENLLLST